MMRREFFGFIYAVLGMTLLSCASQKVVSPNGKLTLVQTDSSYIVNYQGNPVLNIKAQGFKGIMAENTKKDIALSRYVKEDYKMISGKRSHCTNEANEYRVTLDKNTTLVWRLYNDGVAFRYELTALKGDTIPAEVTSYKISEGTTRWMHPWQQGYEEFFNKSTTGEHNGRSWCYPALIEPQKDIFVLISEAELDRNQSGSILRNDQDVEMFCVCPATNELQPADNWHTPWRVAIVGELGDLVESTLINDLSEPCRLTDTDWIEPGVVSWIYWAHNHGSNDYNIIKKYVDMAAELHLPYVLIDAEWDEMKDGKTIVDAVNYAKGKGVKPMIWYNSTTGWIGGAPGPKYRLNKPEDREKEFAWCKSIGVTGVKIDFFNGDGQNDIEYYHDLMESTARHHLLVNFHGATTTRGWQRTYPHMLTTEAVYGAEWYNNTHTFTNKAACHNATLPFTRNVIGPMDYTPCAFSDSQHPHITTHAHELALTVLYESGLQHLADRPESFLAQPKEVKEFLGNLVSAWDDTRFVSGYPGEYAVIARRTGNTWYVAGINGTDEAKTIPVNLNRIVDQFSKAQLFLDGNMWDIKTVTTLPTEVKCQPRGGFVIVISP
ncbi:MAG: glycoside hydrolase family 97 catalytic domain-containing protein [Paraprevotella sp.]|nr:glycoside hydrolase family 97 catalytic domain-containing protein [Paraprevotella sp.]